MSNKVIIKGFAEVEAALRELPKRVAKKVIQQALRKAAIPVLKAVQQATPVDTGALLKSEKIRALKRSRKYFGISVILGSKKFYTGSAFYGAFVQFGHKSRSGSEVPPNDFMTRGYAASKEQAKEIAEKEILEGILSEARSLNKVL